MKYLLDTSAAIWALYDTPKLSAKAREIIEDTSVPLCVSIISAWEIAIKVSIGKLDYAGGSATFMESMMENGIEVLSVQSSHVNQVEKLPFIHRDPFDRLLVATAKADNLTILTADENIRKYDVLAVW